LGLFAVRGGNADDLSLVQVADKLDSLVKLQRDKAQQQNPRRPGQRSDSRRGLFGMF